MATTLPATLLSRQIRHFLIGCGVFMLGITLCFFVIALEQDYLKQRLRATISQHAIDVASRLQAEINSNVYLANGLIAYITAYPERYSERIGPALKALHTISPHLRNLGIAPNNRISHVYPLEGNEPAIGLYYPEIPSQWPAVKKAIETRSTVLAGPLTLKQGGTGLISRTPVFLEDGRYWGIISLVIDSDELFHTVYGSLQRGDVQYAVRNTDPAVKSSRTIFGDMSLFDQDSIKITLSIPGVIWQLAAMPISGWHQDHKWRDLYYVISLALSLGIAVIVFVLLQQRSRVLSSELRLRTILQTTHDGIIVVNRDGLIQEFNPAAESMFGYSCQEAIGNSVYRLFPKDGVRHEAWFKQAAKNKGLSVGRQVTMRHKDNHTFPVEITIGEAITQDQKLYVGVARDITERLQLESKLRDLANTDSLTGVYNRRAVLERGSRLFKLSKRNHHAMTIVMLDLDHFKAINDTYGHQAGDDVLVASVEVFRKSLRETDILGRYGGEEFIAVLPDTTGEQATEVMNRVCSHIREAEFLSASGCRISVTTSLGAAEVSPDDKDIEATIQRADEALYKAKAEGRDQYVLADLRESDV